MSRFVRNRLAICVLSVLGLVALGCGTSTNNDQGTSFTAIGYFTDSTGETGDAGRTVPLSLDLSLSGLEGLSQITYIGLTNRLAQQFVRIDRIDCDYVVPGSSLSVPSDSHSTGFVMEAAGGATSGTDGETSTTGSSRAFIGFYIISTDISSFLNVNQNSLPALPFQLVATCRAIGVSQAGDTLVSNNLSYQITFSEASECCAGGDAEIATTPGFANGSGTGGDLDSGDSGDDEDSSALTDGSSTSVSNGDFVIE